MDSRKYRVVISLLLVSVLVLSMLPFASAAGGKPAQKLTAAERAFAEAVGLGEYAIDVDKIYSYEYGEFDMPLGEAWRGAGSEPAHEYAMYLKEEMSNIGLQNVVMEEFPVHAYNYGGASVQITSPEMGDEWLAAGHAGIPGTPPEGIEAAIEYVGLGTRFDYMDKDVSGKLVLIEVSEEEMYWLQYPLYEAELHGAIGAVVTWIEYADVEDSVATHDSESRPNIPCVSISHENAAYLKDQILAGETHVKIWCDATVDMDGVAYNVYGYLPGTTYPDEQIVIGDHYDKWWYGASDDGCGVATLLGVAKAMVDSGYQPERTMVFLATDAEEYGWSDTEFDWALGAWWAIFDQHPEWVGKTRAYFNLEGGGDAGATSVNVYGAPETQMWRKSILPLINSWFSNNEPWSGYYVPAKEETESFYTTWADGFSFCAAGIPVMEVYSTKSTAYSGYSYHTQMDTMEWISGESLAMTIIGLGIAAMELDKAVVVPYSFQKRVSDLGKVLNEDLVMDAGVDASRLHAAMSDFYAAGDDVWRMIRDAKYVEDPTVVNAELMAVADKVLSELTWVGGYIESIYQFRHYQDDTWYMREGIVSLEDGNIDRALMWLSWVYGMYTGRWCSYENYKYMQVDRWNNDDMKQFWARGRIAEIVDMWAEYDSLLQKKAMGDTDYSAEIASLWEKYDLMVKNYQDSLDSIAATLEQATMMLEDVKARL